MTADRSLGELRSRRPRATPTIVNVGYRSTNFWVIGNARSRLMVDLGWPGMFGALTSNLERMGIPLAEVTHGLATHYHMDHAGCAQDLKNAGMRLIVTHDQVSAIPAMKQWIKPGDGYTDIAVNDNAVISCAESRAFLETIGFGGEIVPTPGHSDDSVTLVLDTGAAFTGDLTHPAFATEETAETVAASWKLLLERGATKVYPGHGPVRGMVVL